MTFSPEIKYGNRASHYAVENVGDTSSDSGMDGVITYSGPNVNLATEILPNIDTTNLFNLILKNAITGAQLAVWMGPYLGFQGVDATYSLKDSAEIKYEVLKGSFKMPVATADVKWQFDGAALNNASDFVPEIMTRTLTTTNEFNPLLTAIYYNNGNTQYFQLKDLNQHLLSTSFSWLQNTNPWTYSPGAFSYIYKGEPAWYKQLDMSRVSIDSVITFYKHPQRTQLMKYTASTKTWEDEASITINDGSEVTPSILDNGLFSSPHTDSPLPGSTSYTHQFGVVTWTGGQEGDYFFFNPAKPVTMLFGFL